MIFVFLSRYKTCLSILVFISCDFQICINTYSMIKSLHHFYCLFILSIKHNTKYYNFLQEKLLIFFFFFHTIVEGGGFEP